MQNMKMLEKVLNRKEIQEKPIVLVDIGASGSIHSKWELLAPNSICIAFDADNRNMDYITHEGDKFKNLYVYPSILTEKTDNGTEFYLTRFPQCSSVLKPDDKNIKTWAISPLLEVTDIRRVKSTNLSSVLSELNLTYIDWFKTDSQGTDLRLFKSIGEDILQKVLIAEFEPGIIDAYIGEDKLWKLMSFMDEQSFWMSDIRMYGTQRFSLALLKKHFTDIQLKQMCAYLKKSPCWAEVTYTNSFKSNGFSVREYLLGWVFVTLENQHGFALEIAMHGLENFDESLFEKLKEESIRNIKESLELTNQRLRKINATQASSKSNDDSPFLIS
jgi:hypothetical protein